MSYSVGDKELDELLRMEQEELGSVSPVESVGVKDVAGIKKFLQFDKQLWKISHVEDTINAGLAQLWADEEVNKALACSVDDNQSYILLFTNKSRVIQCYENKSVVSGFLIDRTVYDHPTYAHDLTYMDPTKVRSVQKSGSGWFSKTYFHVEIDGIGAHPITFVMDDGPKAGEVKNAIISMAKPKAAPSTPSPASTATANTNTVGSSDKAAAIAEIRQMYQDGIIDKDEMLDLIKSLK